MDVDDDEIEGSGLPGRALVAGALLRWSMSAPGASIDQAMLVFNLGRGFVVDALRPDLFGPCDLIDAVQTWSLCRGGTVPLLLACAVFAVRPVALMDMVRDHMWMSIGTADGQLCIDHEGE